MSLWNHKSMGICLEDNPICYISHHLEKNNFIKREKCQTLTRLKHQTYLQCH
ncbi:hypothetical protein MTR_6g034595 [Medicago truncatula]|uniref:Uncharacterized protein n=1 Tax=Medicago truncatula TaxID=3880 RepID=A0A072U7R2_MEDTR|nr:hypothetical protein MTR_6g034595 [Medicago truncatula]